MTVRELNEQGQPKEEKAAAHDWTLTLGKIGVWLAVASFGGIFVAVNGGFSVMGLQVVAEAFNDAGKLLWAALSSLTFPVPIQVPGLPARQPLIPWVGVVSATLLQIVVIYRKLRRKQVPRWMMAAAILLSLYDLGTTYFGLGTVAWIQQAGVAFRGILALIITFIFEVTVSFLLKR